MVRLHVVTGKGGTGKTTVAAALALALATKGTNVLLMEVEGRQGIAQLFDAPPLPYRERKIAVAPAGGDVYGLAVDPEAALLEYLDMYYHLGRAGRMLDRLGAVDFATTIAPGLRDVLLTGKVYEATRRRVHGAYVYDAVVLDAPPTGRIPRFLNVNQEVAGLAKVGPIRSQANSIMTLLHSELTAVHLVTVLEEMPVQETIDTVDRLSALRLPIGAVLVNMVRQDLLDDETLALAGKERLPARRIATDLAAVGLPADEPTVSALVAEAHDDAVRAGLERENRGRVEALDRPVAELGVVADGIDVGALYDLSEQLADQLPDSLATVGARGGR